MLMRGIVLLISHLCWQPVWVMAKRDLGCGCAPMLQQQGVPNPDSLESLPAQKIKMSDRIAHARLSWYLPSSQSLHESDDVWPVACDAYLPLPHAVQALYEPE